MGEQDIMHRPEGALACGGLRSLGSELGPRMHVPQREVTPDIPDVAEVDEQLTDDRLGLATVGALEVRVLDQSDLRLAGTADMIAVGVHRVCEVNDVLGGAQPVSYTHLRAHETVLD